MAYTSEYFEKAYREGGVEGAAESMAEDMFSVIAPDETFFLHFYPWWDEYGDAIPEYDWSREVSTVRGYGEAFKPLRESTNVGLAQTATIGGATGFVGGGYSASMSGQSLMEQYEQGVGSILRAGNEDIDEYWDEYYEYDWETAIDNLIDKGAFDYNPNKPWIVPEEDYEDLCEEYPDLYFCNP